MRTFLSAAFVAALLAASLASPAALAAPSVAERFALRAYVSSGQQVFVSARADRIAVRADPRTDEDALAHLVEEAGAALAQAPATSPVSVVDARRVRAHGLFEVELAAPLTQDALVALAEALSKAPAIWGVYPVSARATGRAFTDDHLVVTAAPGALDAVLAKVLAATDGELVRLSRVPNTAVVLVGEVVGRDAITASAALATIDGLVSAEPDLYRELALTATVDDPLHAEQWHLQRPESGDPVPGTGQIFVHGAWDLTKGDPATVIAVFDSGTDITHPDLAPNIVSMFDAAAGDDDATAACSASPDGASESSSCPPTAPYRESHGTAVSGTAAARGDNGEGLAGVCPLCSLMPVRLLGDATASSISTAEAFVRAVDEGASVINNSWGPGSSMFFPLSQAERDAFEHARTQGRGGLGTVIVFAAGNSTADVAGDPYASSPHVIAVAASTNLDDWAAYSNYGAQISVAAPSLGGVVAQDNYGIHTTDVAGADGYASSDYTGEFSGTSASSPVVAGLVGLVLSANPSLTSEQVRLVLTGSADKIRADKIDWQQLFEQDLEALFDYDALGHSIAFGYGRVNATAAVALAQTPPLDGGPCTEACAACIADRCAMACDAQDDCVDGAVCEEGVCRTPYEEPTALGAPCTDACEYCSPAIDSSLELAFVCTVGCASDVDCPDGFDCRLLEEGGDGVCIVGSPAAGERAGIFSCRSPLFGASLIVEAGAGTPLCSDVCFSEEPGACPLNFHCANATCECTREGGFGCSEYTCSETNGFSDFGTMCFPDDGYAFSCEDDDDCVTGDYCGPQGMCRVDDRTSCTMCDACDEDADCGASGTCLLNRQTGVGVCTRRCVDDVDCPGDSVCREVARRNSTQLLCASPGDDPAAPCDEAWTCTLDVCRDDIPCPDGKVCEDGACVDAPEPADAGERAQIQGQPKGASCGCGNSGGDPTALLGLSALALARARRRVTSRRAA